MPDIEFTDNSARVLTMIDNKVLQALEDVGAAVETTAKRNTRVDTGQTKGSWQHALVENEKAVYIGSNNMNAIYEEFGTGEYALEGNGRKGGWVYRDTKGNYHSTKGKKPRRVLYNAFKKNRSKIKQHIEAALRGLK